MMLSFGQRLQGLREQHHFTIKEVADDADISLLRVSQIEQGVELPEYGELGRLAEAFEISLWELFYNVKVEDK